MEKALTKSEEKYLALSKAEKRVQIAKDVIKQLEIGKLRAKKGHYVPSALEEEGDSRKLIKEQSTCTVCAKGAIFCAKVLKINSIDLGKRLADSWYDTEEEISKYLSKEFTKDQLDLIECVFEKSTGFSNSRRQGFGNDNYEFHFAIVDFVRNLGHKARMIKIMKNIISNKGTFVLK